MKRTTLAAASALLGIAGCQQVLGIPDVTLGSSSSTGSTASSSSSGGMGGASDTSSSSSTVGSSSSSSSSSGSGGASTSSSESSSAVSSSATSSSSAVSSSGIVGTPPSTPAPLSPLNGAHVGTAVTTDTLRPSFYWTKSTGGTGSITYDLQTSIDPAFNTGVTTQSAISGTFYKPATGIAVPTTRPVGENLYWRVSACADGACSPYSAARRIALGRPLKDVNGDGFDDVVAGASDFGIDGTGTAAVFFGASPPNYSGTPDTQIPPQEDGANLGVAVATVDFNGDGYADIVTGSIALNDQGLVHVFYGGAPLDLSATPETFRNPFPTPDQTRLGYALAVGDFDGDGFGDILASAPFDSDGTASPGFVVLYYGKDNSATPPPAQVTAKFSLGSEGQGFGTSVVGLGDVDGDGLDDFAIGSPGANTVYVYLGTSTRMFKAQPTAITISGASIGSQLAPVGDVNGDGFADLAIVDSKTANIYIFFGSLTGIATTPSWTITGLQASPISVLGDCGTGYASFGAGLEPISVFLGSPTPPATSTPAQAGGSFDFSLDEIGGDTWTGDLDGDGLPDLITTRDTGPDLNLLVYRSNSSSTYPAGPMQPSGPINVKLATKVSLVFN